MKRVLVECKDGVATISVDGAKGMECKALTAGLESALGGRVLSDVETPEMQEAPLTNETHDTLFEG